MQTFIGKLKLSEYNIVPRRRFYRPNESNSRNELVAQSMRRNCLDEIQQNFHAVDNHQLLAEKCDAALQVKCSPDCHSDAIE